VKVYPTLRTLSALAAIVVLMVGLGCPPEDQSADDPTETETETDEGNFTVEYPVPIDIPGYGSDYYAWQLVGDYIQITVRFSHAVDMASLLAQNNVILETTENANAAITIAAGTTSKEIIITSQATVFDLTRVEEELDALFWLHLLGSGTNPMTSTDNQILDGDSDGTPGGDFDAAFIVF